jgi:hypothetical protein
LSGCKGGTWVKLPKAALISAMNGGPQVLRSLLDENSGADYFGYIKIQMKLGLMTASGIIVIMTGKPVVAFYEYMDQQMGQQALGSIYNIGEKKSAVLKLYSFPEESKDELKSIVKSLESATINIEQFWNDLNEGKIINEGDEAKPVPVDQMLEDSAKAFQVVVGAGVEIVDIPEEDMDGVGPDGTTTSPGTEAEKPDHAEPSPTAVTKEADGKISKLEAALKTREDLIRKEIDEALQEREQLKKEEEKFLKMDEVFTKLLRDRENELKKKEDELKNKETELKLEIDKKQKDLDHREEELRKEIERLQNDQEEMKKRESNLMEMENMFRRVLANTEERLKKKEEDLIEKEEELKKEVEERMKLIEELRSKEDKVSELEQELREKLTKEITESLKEREGQIKELEETLKKREAELEAMGQSPAAGIENELEIKRLLQVLDDLLGKLPEEVISEFAESDAFELYEKIMKHFKVGSDE